MSYESLQAVIGNAVVDSEFRKGLLNGSRFRIISKFNLTPEETSAVMGIHADSLEHFAGQLDQWMTRAERKVDPPNLPPALRLRTSTKLSRSLDRRRFY